MESILAETGSPLDLWSTTTQPHLTCRANSAIIGIGSQYHCTDIVTVSLKSRATAQALEVSGEYPLWRRARTLAVLCRKGIDRQEGDFEMQGNVPFRPKLILPAVILIVALCLPPPAHAQQVVHIVRRGENLTRIAAYYGTSVQAIARANGLRNPDYIWAGQRLVIPHGGERGAGQRGGCGCVHIVRRGETLSQIAWRYGTSVWAIAQQNGLGNPNYIWAGQRLCIPCGGCSSPPHGYTPPPPCGVTHVVRWGETLYSIARRYGTCVQAIRQANGLWNPNYIWAGQRLYIPCGMDP